MDLLELPAVGTDVGLWSDLDGLEDRDTVGRVDVLANGGGPSQSNNTITGDRVCAQNRKADGGLRSLAGFVGLGRCECGSAEGDADEVVDRVGVVHKSRVEQVGGGGLVVVGQGGDPAGFDGDGHLVGDALGTAVIAAGGEGSGSGGGGSRQGEGSDDAGDTHFDCCVVCLKDRLGLGWYYIVGVWLEGNE